jgi:hypothetical protein
MKWIWSRCRRRQDVSLLAAGVLDQAEIIELERHLDACADCRNYYGEIKILTAPLMGWEKNFSAIEANPAMQMRWAKAMQDAAAPSSIRQPPLQRVWRAMWGESIRPYRYAWSGMAALWVAMLAINGQLSDHRTNEAGVRAASSQEIMQAWTEQNSVLALLIEPAAVVPAPPPYVPGPRSQRAQDWTMI